MQYGAPSSTTVPRAGEAALRSARLKLDLLAQGLRIAPGVDDFLAEHGKPRLRVRSGSCGGLDVILPEGIYANCPVDELFATDSSYVLQRVDDALFMEDTVGGELTPVSVTPSPAYYSVSSAHSGVPLSQVGQLCSDRLGVGLTNACTYWAKADTRCRFCSIGLNVRTGHEIGRKALPDILQVAEAALTDPAAPATHVLLGGGTPHGDDAGALAMAEVTQALKRRWPNVLIYAMVAPPERAEYVNVLVDAGVDEIGINLEVWSDEAGVRYLPGKWGRGRAHCLDMLRAAVDAFEKLAISGDGSPYPPLVGRVRSIMIAGLEPTEHLLTGVEALCDLGVMPILTPFRPMRGTEMEQHPRWSGPKLWDVAMAATSIAGARGLPLGPTCVPCQANTLNIPGHPAYRAY